MSSAPPTRVPVPPGPRGVAAVARAARRLVMDGGPAFRPFPEAHPPGPVDEPLSPQDGVVLTTSGSTADPVPVVIGRDALLASAEAGAAALGPGGHWLTAVPVTGAGGLLTVVRAILAGADPIAWPGVGGAASFTASSFADAGAEVLRRASSDGVPAYVSLVPTQLTRILRSPAAAATLAGFSRVLIGGAALAPALRRQAERAGIRVVGTYGATESCGGVVYDGIPLRGVSVTVAATEHDAGEIGIAGITLARGYLGRPSLTRARFAGGVFHTRDLGRWEDGRLQVVGRADHQVKVGGVLVSLAAVAEQLRGDPRVLDVAVVARPDAEWGHRPHASVVPVVAAGTSGALAADLAEGVVRALGPPARPDPIDIVAELPTTAAGKPVVVKDS